METDSLPDKTKRQLIEEIEHLRQQLGELHAAEVERKQTGQDFDDYRILLDESSDPIFMFHRDGRYRYVNKAFAEGVQRNLEEIIGHTIWDVFPRDEADQRFAVVKWVFENGETRVIEVRVPRTDEDRYYLTTAKPILGENQEVTSVICISKEITERKHMEQKLHYLSTHDALTGVYNRNYFDSELSRLQNSRLYPIGIVIADMNNLKATNDGFGHAAGDELIRNVAIELKRCFRAGDIIARIGGDEFAVLLLQTDEDGAQAAVERLRNGIEQHKNELLSLSIGLAVGESGSYLPAVMRLADDRMYEDKAVYRKEQIRRRQANGNLGNPSHP